MTRIVLILCVVALTSCSTYKTTNTPRGAIEQALLSEAAERSLAALEGKTVLYKRFYLDETPFEAYDEQFILSALRLRLLSLGLHSVSSEKDADLIVYPRAAVAAIDESSSLLGIPSVPIPFPGVGTIPTPELALLKKIRLVARNKIGVYAIDANDRSLAFDMKTASANTYYTRWTILFIISFSKSDLTEPYKMPKKPKVKVERK